MERTASRHAGTVYRLDLDSVASLERDAGSLGGPQARDAALSRLRRVAVSGKGWPEWATCEAMLSDIDGLLGPRSLARDMDLRKALSRPAKDYGWPIPAGMRYEGGVVVSG